MYTHHDASLDNMIYARNIKHYQNAKQHCVLNSHVKYLRHS
jgi:hypothetical protein